MTQKAIIKQILDDKTALVSLVRQMECGLSCDSCEVCPQKPPDELLATADISATQVRQGDLVEVAPNSMGANLASVLVFVFPSLGFVVGYLLASVIGLSSGASVPASFLGAFLGFLPAYICNARAAKRGAPEFNVVRILR